MDARDELARLLIAADPEAGLCILGLPQHLQSDLPLAELNVEQ